MPDTPQTPATLRTNEPEPQPEPRVRGPQTIICKFCKCELAQSGDYIQLSDTAREFRDEKESHRKTKESLETTIGDLNKKISEKDAEIAALKVSETAGKRKSFL